MPYEYRNQDYNEDDDNDAYGSRPAPTAIIDYNRAISHTSHCSFRSSQSARFIPRVQAGIPGGGEASGMWVWGGLVLSVGLTALAWRRSFVRTRTFYEGEVYEMGARTHRKYALGFSIAAGLFVAELAWPGWVGRLIPPVSGDWFIFALLAYLVLTAIVYGSGFLRGATGEDE